MIDAFRSDPQFAIFMALVVIVSVCFHEFCHVLVAHREGDNTAIEQGYLTFNPLKLMGWQSLLMLLLVGIAWGAVPVNPSRFRRKVSDVLVSLAGPLSNLFLFFVFALLFLLFIVISKSNSGSSAKVLILLRYGSMINFVLFLFNLLPIPPLDGLSLVRYFYPQYYAKMMTSQLAQMGMLIVCLILFFNGRYLFAAANSVFDLLLNFLLKIVGLLGV